MNEKILVVDDEPNVLRLLEFSLQEAGYSVILAQDGQEALAKLKTTSVDLVVLDMMMPTMSGIEVCQYLRGKPETTTLPIIMLSARGQVHDKITGLEAGVDEYLTKPIDPDELVARVAALLARTRRLRQTQAQPQGKVIGFIGAKGGVGTTTVALNIAAALAAQGKTVIAAELRSYFGAFSAQLGEMLGENLSHLLELEPAAITEQALPLYLDNHPSGLRLLFGPQSAAQYKSIEPTRAEALIKGLTQIADYTIIDLPAQPSAASQTVLLQCHAIVMVVEPEPGCVLAGKAMLELLSSWRIRNSRIKAVSVNHKAQTLELGVLRSQLSCEIIGIIPPATEACWAAQARHLPLVIHQPNSLAATQLRAIAGQFISGKIIPIIDK